MRPGAQWKEAEGLGSFLISENRVKLETNANEISQNKSKFVQPTIKRDQSPTELFNAGKSWVKKSHNKK